MQAAKPMDPSCNAPGPMKLKCMQSCEQSFENIIWIVPDGFVSILEFWPEICQNQQTVVRIQIPAHPNPYQKVLWYWYDWKVFWKVSSKVFTSVFVFCLWNSSLCLRSVYQFCRGKIFLTAKRGEHATVIPQRPTPCGMLDSTHRVYLSRWFPILTKTNQYDSNQIV